MRKSDDTGLESPRMSAPLPLFDTIEAPPPIVTPVQVATDPFDQAIINATNNQRAWVLDHYKKMGEYGSTDYETSLALRILRTSAGKRRKELCEQGLIIDSGTRRPTDTKATAIVWRIIK